MSKAYPWLLTVSLCLSGVLCWMYVTKPVIVHVSEDVSGASPARVDFSTHEVPPEAQVNAIKPSLLPSDESLPGIKKLSRRQVPNQVASSEKGAQLTDPRQLLGGGDGSGLEATNARVQHILSANNGAGELSKIVLNVPVLYQTRTMRWTAGDVAEARSLLNRLVGYESQLAKLRKEGQYLMAEWNRLMQATVPASSLRADSPSLPHNQTLTSPPNKSGGGLPHAGVEVETKP